MALKAPVAISRPDHTKVTVGDQGDATNQEAGTGKNVIRRGGTEAECDIDVATVAEPHDLIDDGNFESGMRVTGGAEALAGDLISADGATFTVEVDWLNEDGEVLRTHDPSALQDVTELDFNLIVRSDRFEVRVMDTSGGAQNNIHGSINAH